MLQTPEKNLGKIKENPIIELEKPFVDARGSIQPLIETMIASASIISSKKGTVRANHYHKTDWHYCYVVSGAIEYYTRPVGSTETPKPILIKAGQLFFTPPLLEHAMKFVEDTVFLNLTGNPREQEAYEGDVIRVNFVNN